MDSLYLEVKFATRFDSPACLDIFDLDVKLIEKDFTVEAMCRNDKKLLKYQLNMDLFDTVYAFDLDGSKQKEYDEEMEKFKVEDAEFYKLVEDFNKKNDIYTELSAENDRYHEI